MRPRGTVIKRGGAYAVVVDRGVDSVTGRRQRDWHSGYRTRRAAERARTQLLHDLDNGRYADPHGRTLGQYLQEQWLPSRKPKGSRVTGGHRGQVSLRTWSTNRQHLEAYVIPYIGRIPLQKLRADDLGNLYDMLEETGGQRGEGLSPTTVLHVHRTLHRALKDAVKQGLLAVNVAATVDPPRSAPTQSEVWTVDQLQRFLEHVRDHRVYAAWLLFATTGMRRGEVAALAQEDLDLDRGRLRVSWTLGIVASKLTWKPAAKSKAGERVMALDPATVEALRRRFADQAADRRALGRKWPARQYDERGQYRDDPVFTWPDGSIISPSRYTEWFAKSRDDAGLPRIRLHDVRHTYASFGLAQARGWHEVKVISQRLGHASVGFTLDSYAHVLPAADEETAHTLARHILGGTAT